eukprot:TRINITY_DN1669_c0_g1_i2.p1 TRINITY_DN1669_c0_g1~~TRINITY_DN1669_c0_g1_i2.p1  ORF type:complete len:578 (+),score=171.84 TRINITY_DN1669_c0_g1_i2:158-1735(+)
MEQTPEESVELEGSPQVSAPTTPPRSVKKRKEERRIEALQMTPLALHLESNASHHSPSGESKVLEETIDETKIDKIDGDSQRWLASQKSMNEDERDDLMLHLIAENDLLKQEMESLGDRVSELIGINERNFEHIAELVKETNSLRRQLQQEQNAHQRIRADYEMMRSRSSKLEIVAQDESFDAKRLRSLLDEKDTKIHDLYGEKRELNGMLGVLKRQLSASENEVKRHQADIRMFEREKMRMKAVIQEEREKIMSSIQSKRTSEAALKKLKLLVTTLQEKVHHFQSTQKNTDATVSSLQAKLDACVPYTEKEQLELALESERTKKEEMEIAYQSKLKEHIQLYTTETMKLRKENAKLRKRISLVQDELDKKKAKTADENDGALLPETKYSMGKGDKGKQIHDEDKGDGSGGEQEKVEEHVQKAEMESLKRELAESHQQLDDMVRSMAQMKESLADRSKSLHETQRRLRKVEKRKQILDDENKEYASFFTHHLKQIQCSCMPFTVEIVYHCFKVARRDGDNEATKY